ncbi:hypothetical protein Hanom_Chr05g00456501 [Helianthus anomalus]
MANRYSHVKCTLSGPPYDYVVVGRDVDNHEGFRVMSAIPFMEVPEG